MIQISRVFSAKLLQELKDEIKVRRLFLIGNSLDDNSVDPLKEQHEALLQAEANEYGDILQGEFHDSFRNLTLKEIMFLNWLPKHCPKTQFIFKVRFISHF